MKKRLLQITSCRWNRLRSLVLLCFLLLAALGVHANPEKVEYYLQPDGTYGFYFPADFLYSEGHGVEIQKVVIPKIYEGKPVKWYLGYGDFHSYLDGDPKKDPNHYCNASIDTLIVEAEIEEITTYFQAAHVMYFPKSLKKLTGMIISAHGYNYYNYPVEIYFEQGSQLETLGERDLCSLDWQAEFRTFRELQIPPKVKTIGDFSFAGQGFYNVCKYPLPKGLEYIGRFAFASTTNTECDESEDYYWISGDSKSVGEVLTIPASVKTIDQGAFYGCCIETVIIEDGTNLTIGKSAFYPDVYSPYPVKTVICKSTTPFKMYSGTADYFDYHPWDDSGSDNYTYPFWDDSPNFPPFSEDNYPYTEHKPRLYVPVGYKEVYEKWETEDEHVQYKDIFDIIEGVTWGTIVVPTANQKAFLKDIARLAELKSCDMNNASSWRLVFDEIPVTFETTLKKGNPYLCVPPLIEVSGSGTVNSVSVQDNGYTVTYTGNLSGEDSYVPAGAYYFGSTTGKCYLNEKGNSSVVLKNGRCYFQVSGPSSAKPTTMDVVMNELDGSQSEATAIDGMLITSKKDVDATNDVIYNLQGVRMNGQGNLPKGIYIQNGKKVVIK